MLRKAMEKQNPAVVKLQADRRTVDGGGTLPLDRPPRLAPHLPLERWVKFREVVNRALKSEKNARAKIRGTSGVPTLLGVASCLGSGICIVIVLTLQLDDTVTAVATASPPILALCFWALMFVLQRKHFRLHTRALDDANRCVREACESITREYRALAVKMHMGDEAVESLDWLGRARLDSRDAFYIEFRILDESFEPLGERSHSRLSDRTTVPRSTRPQSESSGGSSALLRLTAQGESDELILRPVSAPDPSSEQEEVRIAPDRRSTPNSDMSRSSKQAWA